MTCCFFGHGNTPEAAAKPLEAAIRKLIEDEGADCFLVGNHGAFDRMALSALRRLAAEYPHITYHVVLAYLPGKAAENPLYAPEETLFPEGLEKVPPRFAISWRNRWLVKSSDVVIAYIAHSWGGAAQFVELAKRQGKPVINLYKQKNS